MQMLEVVVALLVEWRLVAIQEIVVERDADGLDAVYGELYAEALTGSRLTTARRSGDKHQLDTLALGYLVGYLADLLLLKGLAYLNQLWCIAFTDNLIQVADGAQSQNVLPLVVLLEDAEHLILMRHLAQFRRVFP